MAPPVLQSTNTSGPMRTRNAKRERSSKSPRANGSRWVYAFGGGRADGDRTMRELLGGKGANLAEMSNLGLPVPPGFTITTAACTHWYANGKALPSGLEGEVKKALARVEELTKKRFGDGENPLLVSVRSGARVSMPGMMDTVLNLGLNERTVEALARRADDERFAWDSYRRFVQMYADVVLDLKPLVAEHGDPFGAELDALKRRRGVANDPELGVDDLRWLVDRYKAIVRERLEVEFPDDPWEQLWGAIGAVFGSWNCDRAVAYRALNQIPGDWGTAVNVVAMVFGNLGEESGTGVAFTRDPSTGEKRFYGEYLMNAQGEDVVAGIRTPLSIDTLGRRSPAAWKELLRIQKELETHFRDMQDIEFTIEDGKLYVLQCRSGKRTGFAAVRIAVDMARERLISREEALMRVEPHMLDQLLQPVFDRRELADARKAKRRLTKGLNAGPGAASGRVVLSANDAVAWKARGETVVLVRLETSPEDILGMQASAGILTARGGMTSHAALVARQMGKVCVAGAGELDVDHAAKRVRVAGREIREGDWISIDGSTGEVYEGRVATQPSEVLVALFGKPRDRARAKKGAPFRAFTALMRWADEIRELDVRANADQPEQCAQALAFGAEGVGLCRTEHMFFSEGKIEAMREMILARDGARRVQALNRLLPLQKKDFAGIFREMRGHPVTIRTLDPPLHEFLPHDVPTIEALAEDMGVAREELERKIESMREVNPMLGHRGCRLGITYPEITIMQARAIFEAACEVARSTGKKPKVEIMIPLVGTRKELDLQAGIVRNVATKVFEEHGCSVPFQVGTMIELPRAAITADRIAQTAEFFSFGTNDLTQTTFGISRDDGGRFLGEYVASEILPEDPFATLDREGVGELMRIAVEKGRSTRAGLKVGICGEHGGDPDSIAFCHQIGLDYVSCSPFRVPLARLAAAQAELLVRMGRARVERNV